MDRSRDFALLALRAVTSDGSDDALIAEALGSQETAAEAMSVLAGYLLQALALHRGEDVHVTARFVEHFIDDTIAFRTIEQRILGITKMLDDQANLSFEGIALHFAHSAQVEFIDQSRMNASLDNLKFILF